ncbi:hypothetical protein IB642_07955 [Allofrancisella guangzhouensis]|uniref:chitinase n=1 Tax=Allofrancisella guangzhouensis TaxID=594679 RepID=UPI000690C38D|nr:chitinase [Allofrancisella guangzhouensis]MBK2027862.1 hypothetical protein [Allofrancisella guangzhouensis]MBK2044936.1 hypothetical protein [Allofrancisella guangzhouensis]MBK2046458.1 hypothetical protein [Allofrancisella guangzhouensis]
MKLKVKFISAIILALMSTVSYAGICAMDGFKKIRSGYIIDFTCYDDIDLRNSNIVVKFNNDISIDRVWGIPGNITQKTKARNTLITSEAWYPEGTGAILENGKTYHLHFSIANDADNIALSGLWIGGDYVNDNSQGNIFKYPVYPKSVDQVNLSNRYVMTQEELDAKEAELTNDPKMLLIKNTIRTRDNKIVEIVKPLSPNNPENVKRVESIISEKDWNYIFPKRSVEYTYENFLKAVAKFPAFCGSYDDGRDADAICRKSLATMFAHFTQETGGHTAHWDVPEWRQGLVLLRESGFTEKSRNGYNQLCSPTTWQGETWPCGKFKNGEFKSYFGRGSKQLKYNYNYGSFSQAMFGDASILLDNPELVADTWLNLASDIFFFVYPQSPKPSILHVIDGTWQPNAADKANGLFPGFGITTQIINGGVECGKGTEAPQSINRINYYENFAKYLNVEIPADEVLGCKAMKPFNAQGSGTINNYWEQNYVIPYECKLVNYQTPFSAFIPGDYTKCVKKHFDISVKDRLIFFPS